MVAYRFEGRRYDCGRKLGYLEATVDLGLKHPEIGEGFARFLAVAAQVTLNELRYLVAVAQERNFGRAAQKCFVSQPALSVAIQKLEEELGTLVFERGKNEVTITPVGERIVEQAQRVLEESSRIREIAQSGRNQLTGTLHARRHLHRRTVPAARPHPGAARARAADAARHRGEPDREPRGGTEVRAARCRDRRAAVRAAGRGHRVPLRGAVPGRRSARRTSGRSASRCSPRRALRREHDPAQRRALLPRPGARVVPRAQPGGRPRAAHQLARDDPQHGGVGARHLGAAARRADAEVSQPAGGAGAVRAARARRAASRSRIGGAFRGPRPSQRCANRSPLAAARKSRQRNDTRCRNQTRRKAWQRISKARSCS